MVALEALVLMLVAAGWLIFCALVATGRAS